MIEVSKALPVGSQPIAESTAQSVGIRKFSTAIRMQVIELRRQKVSGSEIAKQLGVSRSFVYSCLRQRKGVSGRALPRPKELRVKSESPQVPKGSLTEKAKIVFPSGIFLEMPMGSIKAELIKILSEVG